MVADPKQVMSHPVMLIDEVKPWPPAKVYVEAYPSVQKRHDAGPYSKIAPEVKAHWVRSTAQNVPWPDRHRGYREKECWIRTGDAKA
jgi:hypothetical protein